MTETYGIEELAGFAHEVIRRCGDKALEFYGQGGEPGEVRQGD